MQEMRSFHMNDLLDTIKTISDLNYQREGWLGGTLPNWEETMCQFFDDACIDDFLNDYEPEYGLSGPQVAALWKLRNIMRKYSDATPQTMDAKDVLADPRWHEVAACAKETLKVFEGYTVPSETSKERDAAVAHLTENEATTTSSSNPFLWKLCVTFILILKKLVIKNYHIIKRIKKTLTKFPGRVMAVPFIAKDWKEVIKTIPSNWDKVVAKSGNGIKYQAPSHSAYHEIRFMKGDSQSDLPIQRIDYVKIKKYGQCYDLDGNKVFTCSSQSCIPLEGNQTRIENIIGELWS